MCFILGALTWRSQLISGDPGKGRLDAVSVTKVRDFRFFRVNVDFEAT